MDKTKGQLLAHYAEKEPKTFWQYDGFVGQSADDYVMKADGDGDSIMWGVTQELMTGMYGVRVLVTAGTSQADAVRVLGKIREIIGHNGFAWQERGQAELTTELDGATRGERVAELSYNDWKERAGVLLEKAKLSAEDTTDLLMQCSVPLEDLPAEVVEANPFIKWWLGQKVDGEATGGAVINWAAMCDVLERWLAHKAENTAGAVTCPCCGEKVNIVRDGAGNGEGVGT